MENNDLGGGLLDSDVLPPLDHATGSSPTLRQYGSLLPNLALRRFRSAGVLSSSRLYDLPTEAQPLLAAAVMPAPVHSSGGRGGTGGHRPPRRLEGLHWPPLFVRLYEKLVAPLMAAAQLRRLDDDSYTCYVSYVLLFLSDMSVLAAVMPLSMLLYSLLLPRKPLKYWNVSSSAVKREWNIINSVVHTHELSACPLVRR